MCLRVCIFLCSVQKGDSLLHYTPTLSDKDFNRTLGLLSSCSFLPNTATAVSTTSEGSAVVWEVDQQVMGAPEKRRKGEQGSNACLLAIRMCWCWYAQDIQSCVCVERREGGREGGERHMLS